jgi:hypothetical protein
MEGLEREADSAMQLGASTQDSAAQAAQGLYALDREVLDGGYASTFLPRGTPLYTLQIFPKPQLSCDACQAVLASWDGPPEYEDFTSIMEAHQCPERPTP